jgi:hypothetical protein
MRIIEVDRETRNDTVLLRFHFTAYNQLVDDSDSRPLPFAEITELAEDTLFSYTDEFIPKKPLAIEIGLPEHELPAMAEKLIPEAISRHFLLRIPGLEHDLNLIRREGFYSLLLMIITAAAFGVFAVVVVMLYMDGSLQPVTSLPSNIIIIAITGFILMISNWVTFWATIEIFMYDYRNMKRKIKMYQKISRILITVRGTAHELS